MRPQATCVCGLKLPVHEALSYYRWGADGGGEPLPCLRTTICVSSYYYMCVRILLYVSSYYYIFVLILLYICPHTTICVSSYYYMCPLATIYMCPHATICVLMLLHMCPHATTYVPHISVLDVALQARASLNFPPKHNGRTFGCIAGAVSVDVDELRYVSSYWWAAICVLILLYLCPHTSLYVSACCCIRVQISSGECWSEAVSFDVGDTATYVSSYCVICVFWCFYIFVFRWVLEASWGLKLLVCAALSY